MEYQYIILQLEKNRAVFESLLNDKNKEEYLWKSTPEKWSLLEIICHLFDEEREDFRARLAHVLTTPTQPLPPIDPMGWVETRQYIQANYHDTLNNFLRERYNSVQWLKSLVNANWENAYQHPQYGPLTATMFLTNWLAHDYLHVRQITKLNYEYLKYNTSEDLRYAGDW